MEKGSNGTLLVNEALNELSNELIRTN